MKKFYVYRLVFEDGRFYIGYRGSKLEPESDLLVKYNTSSKIVKSLLEIATPCNYEILFRGLDKETAYEKEQEIIKEYINEEKCLNQVCYYGRDGFGIMSEDAKKKMSKKIKERWDDPEYKKKMSEIHKKRWAENPNLKEEQVKRLSGKKRPEHSKKMTGRKFDEDVKEKMRKPKCEGHGENVSKALKGKPKSEDHKKSLGISRQKYQGVFIDHVGNKYEHHKDFLDKYELDKCFFDSLDKPIRYRAIYDKLGIEYETNKNKTRIELGFRFQEV